MATILDGKTLAKKITEDLKEKVSKLSKKPNLVAILVGENPASKLYVGMKEKMIDAIKTAQRIVTLSAVKTPTSLSNRHTNITAKIITIVVPTITLAVISFAKKLFPSPSAIFTASFILCFASFGVICLFLLSFINPQKKFLLIQSYTLLQNLNEYYILLLNSF